MSDNAYVAALLYEIGDLIALRDEPFRARAYSKAARTIEFLERPLRAVEHLTELPNIGSSTAHLIHEILETGRSRLLDDLKAEFPPQIFALMDIPGLGARKAIQLATTLRLNSVDDLEAACMDGRVASVKGFGAKTAARLLQGIEIWRQRDDGITLWLGLTLSERFVPQLEGLPGVEKALAVGDLRRSVERVPELRFVVATETPSQVLSGISALPAVARVVSRTETTLSFETARALPVHCLLVPPAEFGVACVVETGSEAFVDALRARGPLGGDTEEAVLRGLGLPWIPPELRETAADVTEQVPRLLEVGDLRGDLHAHTTASDGGDSLEAMAEAARARGYRYLAITEHSRSLPIANGLSIERLLEHGEKIAELNRQWDDFRVLWGSECDILSDGSMDYPDEVLARLDVVVASIHSQFRLDAAQQTARLVRAMQNPHVDVIGHPTGRLLSGRTGYELDWDQVLRVAADTGTALEINASPNRMDLRDEVVKRVRAMGGRVAIDSDSHSTAELRYLPLGVRIARRARLEPQMVLNTAEQL